MTNRLAESSVIILGLLLLILPPVRAQVGWHKTSGGTYLSSPAVVDLNGDGRDEILICTLSDDDKLYIFNHDGSVFDPGSTPWPKALGFLDGTIGSVAVGDVDGDSGLEIVFAGDDSLSENAAVKVYEIDGTLRATYTLPDDEASAKATPCLIDCYKHDGTNSHPAEEILLRDGNGDVHALYWNGTGFSNLTSSTFATTSAINQNDRFGSQPITSSVAATPLGSDTTFIAVGSTDNTVYRWEVTSNASTPWSVGSPTEFNPSAGEDTQFLSSPAFVDLDGDLNIELIAGSLAGEVFVWNQDGSLRTGWPRQANEALISSPACADINGDGYLEIVIGCNDGGVYVFEHDGTALPGWSSPVLATLGDTFSSPAIAEIDGSSGLEIVAASFDRHLYAWNKDGDLLPGWPKRLNSALYSSPAVADIHGGGRMSVIIGSYDGRLFVFDLARKSLDVNAGWQQFRGGPDRQGRR